MANYPEHDKLALIHEQSRTCGEFLEWLESQGYTIKKWYGAGEGERRAGWGPRPLINQLLAEFFDIDQAKIDEEKRAMLDAIRAARLKETQTIRIDIDEEAR